MKSLFQLLGATASLLLLVTMLAPRPVPPPQRPEPERETPARKRLLSPLRPHRSADPIQEGYVLWSDLGDESSRPMVDFPDELWKKNIAGSDGAGMCVARSAEFAALWLGLPWEGFTEYCARGPGGGYPEKLARWVKDWCRHKGIPEPVLLQYEGEDPRWIEQALANGWLPCVTLYHSPRYKDRAGNALDTIYHMTCAAHLDRQRGATLDNNFRPLEWAPRAEWERRIKLKGQFWAFCFIAPGVPPVPN